MVPHLLLCESWIYGGNILRPETILNSKGKPPGPSFSYISIFTCNTNRKCIQLKVITSHNTIFSRLKKSLRKSLGCSEIVTEKKIIWPRQTHKYPLPGKIKCENQKRLVLNCWIFYNREKGIMEVPGKVYAHWSIIPSS